MPLYDEGNIPTLKSSLDVRINGPLNDLSEGGMRRLLSRFLAATGLHDYKIYFTKGMYLAQNRTAFDYLPRSDGLELTADEREVLDNDGVPIKPLEKRGSGRTWNIDFKKWKNVSSPLWRLVCLCALGATVQGWDESAVNGAQLYYQNAYGIKIESPQPGEPGEKRPILVGLVNSAPYLACVFSCWLTPWLNRHFGRRGTIFWTAIFSAAFAFAQAFANTWEMLFVFRFLMGFGIGPKSATIPIYAAECSPANLRGSLVMLWQLFTAVGIMLGSITGVIFQNIGRTDCEAHLLRLECSWNWRLMLASPMVAPIVLASYIYTQSESPRWLINEGHRLRINGYPNLAQARYQEAWEGLTKLRRGKVQAAKDMFEIYHLLESERQEVSRIRDMPGRSWLRKGVLELFAVRRNRRATIASLVCMFAQQFCGVNVIVYYSNYYLQKVTGNHETALLFTMGFGIINFVCGIPAFYTIDSIGRRSLLLITFPFLAIFQFMTASAFAGATLGTFGGWRLRLALAGTYLFGIAYSPGEGPVPFVYAAESMPLYIRDQGMGLVVSINWLFNWLIAFTLPKFFAAKAFTEKGAFYYYSGWCVALWFMIFFLVPETRNLSLEQLDLVFQHHSSREFAGRALEKAVYNIMVMLRRISLLRRHFRTLRDAPVPPRPLYAPIGDAEATEMHQPSSRTLSVSEVGSQRPSNERSRSLNRQSSADSIRQVAEGDGDHCAERVNRHQLDK